MSYATRANRGHVATDTICSLGPPSVAPVDASSTPHPPRRRCRHFFCHFANTRVATSFTMAKSRLRPLRHDMPPGTRVYCHGGRYNGHFAAISRWTVQKVFVIFDEDPKEQGKERCIFPDHAIEASVAPYPDPKAPSAPPPRQPRVQHSPVTAVPVAARPSPPTPTQPRHPAPLASFATVLVRGIATPTGTVITQEPLLHHRFLMCCTSFAAAGIDPLSGFTAFFADINATPGHPIPSSATSFDTIPAAQPVPSPGRVHLKRPTPSSPVATYAPTRVRDTSLDPSLDLKEAARLCRHVPSPPLTTTSPPSEASATA